MAPSRVCGVKKSEKKRAKNEILGEGHPSKRRAMSTEKTTPITSAQAPDLDAVRRFLADLIARGAMVALIAAVIALVSRMRDLNTELMARLASKSRNSPWDGWKLTGKVRHTLYRGRPTVRDSEPTR